MKRRTLLLAAPTALLVSGCSAGEVAVFPTITSAHVALTNLKTQPLRTTGAWPIGVVLAHLAQSIEYSLKGFPEMKGAAFRATAGAAAWSVFSARGAMRHGLDEPIPGAPPIDSKTSEEQGTVRLLAALAAFEAHRGALQPHFAYGDLNKADYARAHLMHMANHWQEFVPMSAAKT